MRRNLLTVCLVLAGATSAHAQRACPPLPPPSGPTVRVTNDAELQSAIRNLADGTTVVIADGLYDLSNTLQVRDVRDVVIRGESGDRDAVVLRGRGMSNGNFGNVPHGFLIGNVDGVLIADLTIREFYYHALQLQGERGVNDVTMRNLRLIDSGEQHVKGSSGGPPGPYADNCIVECCLIEFTDRARSWYTNGVDVLAGANWIIRDNIFLRIRAPVGELAGPAVLFWRNSLDTVVERNAFIECDRGVALGLSSPDANSRDGEMAYDHQGGVVRNNVIYRAAGSPTGDVGISAAYCRDYTIAHNTVILEGSFAWTIEYRFGVSDGVIAYNLTDGQVLRRNGASGTLTGNVTNAQANWFVDAAAGDLHLDPSATAAIDQAAPMAGIDDDLDGDLRPSGAAPDVGADELVSCTLPSTSVTGLRARLEGRDVVLTWDPEAGVLGYNVWYVTERSDGGLTRLATSPPAIPVGACAEPTPAATADCRHVDALGTGDRVHYYRVRATCGGPAEGP